MPGDAASALSLAVNHHAAAPPRMPDCCRRVRRFVYGGVTANGFGLMVETNEVRTKIVRLATGLELH